MKPLIWLVAILALICVGLCLHSAWYSARIEKAHPPNGQVIGSGDTATHVMTLGTDGPVVLMIHGVSANAHEFASTLGPDLARDHRVLMADRPGHGYSARGRQAHLLEVQASRMAAILDTLAPGEKAVIVGHSFGGAVALRLALDYADLVDSLVLLAPVSHDWGGGGEAWYNKYAGHGVIGPAFTQLVSIVGPAQVKSGIKGVFHPEPAPENYYENSAIGLLFRPTEFRANARDVNALREELIAQQDRYSEIKVPITVFSGAKDTVIAPRLHVGRLKYQVDDLNLVALETSGHMPHHTHKADVVAQIRTYSQD